MITLSPLDDSPLASGPARPTADAAAAIEAGAALLARPGRGCCFTFHRVAARANWADQPDLGFHLDLSYLERLVIHLQRSGWSIVSLSDALERRSQSAGGRWVNFSVDDCYRDTAELLVPLFRRLGAPITLFVTTGIPDRLMRLRNAGLETVLQRNDTCVEAGTTFPLRSRRQKRAAFRAISTRWGTSADADQHYACFCRRNGHDPDALDDLHRITWPMLDALAADPGVEIGGHTVRHSRISALDEAEAMAEIAGCRERLEAKLRRPVRHFAFPYGRSGDCGARDFALARRAGFQSASTTRKGLTGPEADPFQLPRNTLNGRHRRLPFAYAHLSGASGLAARVTRRA